MKITLIQLLIIAGVLLVASLFLKPVRAGGYETFVDAPATLPDFMKDDRLSVPLTEEEKVKLLAFYEAYAAVAYKDTAIEMSKKAGGDQVQIFTDILGGTYGVTPSTIFLIVLPDMNAIVSGFFGKPWKDAFASGSFKNAIKRNIESAILNPASIPLSRLRRPVSEENKFLQKYNEVMARFSGAEMNENVPTPGAPPANVTPAAASTGATPPAPAPTAAAASTGATPPAPAPAPAPAAPATPAISENATPAEKLRQLKALLKCANMADVAEPEVTYKLVSNFLKCQSA